MAVNNMVNNTAVKMANQSIIRTIRPWLLFALWGIILLLIVPATMSDFQINTLGKFMTYAIAAIALDLIWGYTGMLSLGQGLFFGLGAYCFAMYLKLEHEALPEFMGLYGVEKLPALWVPFHSPVFAIFMGIALPMAVAAILGYMVFRSRIQGVYFSIITQALTFIVSLLLIGQQQLINGTNGLTDFTTMFGFPLKDPKTQLGLYLVTVVFLGLVFLLCRWITRSRFGRLLVAIRDDENRVRFAGYNPVKFKVLIFALSAGISGLAGMLFVPQVGIISPANLDIIHSIEIVIWVAVGGRGSLVGPVIGALLVNTGKSSISTAHPDTWQLIMGALFIGSVLLFPNGIVGLRQQIPVLWRKLTRTRSHAPTPPAENAETSSENTTLPSLSMAD